MQHGPRTGPVVRARPVVRKSVRPFQDTAVESRANFGSQLSVLDRLTGTPELLMTKVAPRALRTIHLVVVKLMTMSKDLGRTVVVDCGDRRTGPGTLSV